MARIEITQDTASPAIREAATALGAGETATLMLEDIGEYLVRSTRERAEREVSPDGTAWAALSPRYKKFKDKKGVPKLKFDFHMLGDQFTHQVAGDELFVGTNAKYGAIHQFGGEIKIPARTREVLFRIDRETGVSRFAKRRRANFAQDVTIPAYKVNMPARPWLGLSAEDEAEILAIAGDHVAGVFKV